jgi:hypothetical protein
MNNLEQFIKETERDIAYNLNCIVGLLNSYPYKEDFNQYDEVFSLLRLAECQKERLETLRRIKSKQLER